MKICRVCGVELNDNNWYPSCKKKCDYICIECCKIRTKIDQLKNKEHYKEYRKNYRILNKTTIDSQIKEWRLENKDRVNELGRGYNKRTKEKIIRHYSNGTMKCACCGEDDINCLSIDHINNNGTEHKKETGGHLYWWIKKNNFPEGFQVLCYNCNIVKYIVGNCDYRKKEE